MDLQIVQKLGLLKTWEFHFSLVRVMDFSTISSNLGKGKTFSDNSTLTGQIKSTFNVQR